MTDRITELRTLRQQWLDAPMDTGDRYTAMRLYEFALVNAGPDLFDCAEALRPLLHKAINSVCQHEETHRGGAIWEICDDCGMKWADDEGGKPEWVDPPEWTAAIAALNRLNGDDHD